MPAEDLHDADILLLIETATTELGWHRLAEHAELAQPAHYLVGNLGIAVDLHCVDVLVTVLLHRCVLVIGLLLLSCVELGVREKQVAFELTEEEALGEAELGEFLAEHLLDVFFLRVDLLLRQGHGRNTTC